MAHQCVCVSVLRSFARSSQVNLVWTDNFCFSLAARSAYATLRSPAERGAEPTKDVQPQKRWPVIAPETSRLPRWCGAASSNTSCVPPPRGAGGFWVLARRLRRYRRLGLPPGAPPEPRATAAHPLRRDRRLVLASQLWRATRRLWQHAQGWRRARRRGAKAGRARCGSLCSGRLAGWRASVPAGRPVMRDGGVRSATPTLLAAHVLAAGLATRCSRRCAGT